MNIYDVCIIIDFKTTNIQTHLSCAQFRCVHSCIYNIKSSDKLFLVLTVVLLIIGEKEHSMYLIIL